MEYSFETFLCSIVGSDQFLLIFPPVFWPKMPPIGLGYLQSYLSQNGIGSEILDLNNIFYNLADNHLKREWLISCNLCLERNILKLIQNNQYREYCEVINKILGFDVIGFSCFKSNFQAALEITRVIKSKRKDIRIIFGGPEITRQFFKGKGGFDKEITRLVDLLVVGEGERPLRDYLSGRRITGKISKFEQVESLSELAFPEYPGLDFSLYPRKDALPIQFSRGCIRKCDFCSERLLYKGFRSREIESVIDEIRYHKENNQINYFVFFDSLINGDLVKLEILCDEIINNFGLVNWEAQIAVRDDMREEIFAKMKRSGCYNLFVGLESGSDRTLKRMNKGFTAEQAAGFLKKLKSAGFFFGISMIIGYPGETERDFRESLDFIIQNKDIIPKIEQVNPFTYYDGTNTDRNADYKLNKTAVERMEIFIQEIKQHNFRYTNAFLGNLMEKNG